MSIKKTGLVAALAFGVLGLAPLATAHASVCDTVSATSTAVSANVKGGDALSSVSDSASATVNC